MAPSLDELIEPLLDSIALCGSKGVDDNRLRELIQGIHVNREQDGQAQVRQQPESSQSNAEAAHPTHTVDGQVFNDIRERLIAHPDIADTEVRDQGVEGTDDSATEPLQPRLVATEKRIWLAVTGHGVDHTRIPPLMFDLLSVIASHGAEGIPQGDLVRATGQDKHSVPKRTDTLTAKGYIIKEPVVTQGTRTSLLTLKRLAKDEADQQANQNGGRKSSERYIIRYDVWYDKTIELLQNNNGVMMFDDLRMGLGLQGSKWEVKDYSRCMRRLAEVACVRRITAQVSGLTNKKGEPLYKRTIQLLREPTESDRAAFKQTPSSKQRLITGRAETLDGWKDSSGDEEEPTQEASSPRDTTPQVWKPADQNTDFLINVIDNAGPNGIDSDDLAAESRGVLSRRQMERMLQRVSFNGEITFNDHIRALAVIQHGATYRTARNFATAVDDGKITWEAIGLATAPLLEQEPADPVEHQPGHDGNLLVNGRTERNHDSNYGLDHAQRSITALTGREHTLSAPLNTENQNNPSSHVEKQSETVVPLLGIANVEIAPILGTGSKHLRHVHDDDDAYIASVRRIAERSIRYSAANSSKHVATESRLDDHNTTTTNGGLSLSKGQNASTGLATTKETMPRPAIPSVAVPKKKRGRPTQAMLAERERLMEAGYDAVQAKQLVAQASVDDPAFADTLTAEASSNSVVTKRAQPPESQPPLTAEQESDVLRLQGELLARTRPGVYINPPGARALKAHLTLAKQFRRHNVTIAVFKSEVLKTLPWFTEVHPKVDSRFRPALKQEDVIQSPVISTPRGSASEPVAVLEIDQIAFDKTNHMNVPVPVPVPARAEEVLQQDDMAQQQGESRPTNLSRLNQTEKNNNIQQIVGGTNASHALELIGRGEPGFDPSSTLELTAQRDLGRSHDTPLARMHKSSADHGGCETPQHATLSQTAAAQHKSSETRVDPNPASEAAERGQRQTEQNTKSVPRKSASQGTGDLRAQRWGPGTDVFERKKLIMDILKHEDGAYPAGNAIWIPLAAAWQKRRGEQLDRQTVTNTLKGLVNSGKVKKFSFQVPTEQGPTARIDVLALPHLEASSDAVQNMKDAIKQAWPERYIPSAPAVNNDVNDSIREADHARPPRPSTPDPRSMADAMAVGSKESHSTPAVQRDKDDNGFPLDTSVVVTRPAFAVDELTRSPFKSPQRAIAQTPKKKGGWPRGKPRKSTLDRTIPLISSAPRENELSLQARDADLEVPANMQHSFNLSLDPRINRPSRLPAIESSIVRRKSSGEALHSAVTTANSQYRGLPFFLHSAARNVNALLIQPQQEFSSSSGTFSSQGVVDSEPSPLKDQQPAILETHRKVGRARNPELPKNLQEVLARDPVHRRVTKRTSVGDWARFCEEVEKVQSWEHFLVDNAVELVPTDDFHFINHTLLAPHIRSADEYLASEAPHGRRAQGRDSEQVSQTPLRRQAKPVWAINHPLQVVEYDTPVAFDDPTSSCYTGVPESQSNIMDVILESPYSFRSRKRNVSQAFPELREEGNDDATPIAGPLPKQPKAKRAYTRRIAQKKFADENRLIAALALVRALCGGVESQQCWPIVDHALEFKHGADVLHEHWNDLRHLRSGRVKELQTQLLEPFLDAYEQNKLPNVNFDKIEHNDWPSLLKWLEREVVPRLPGEKLAQDDTVEPVQLPQDRDVLEREFSVGELALLPVSTNDHFFTEPARFTRNRIAQGLLRGSYIGVDQNNDQLMLAKSWARASASTKEDNFNQDAAVQTLRQFRNDHIQSAVALLESDQILEQLRKGRRLPGRNYTLHGNVFKHLQRWPNSESLPEHRYLREVARARQEIISELEHLDELELGTNIDEAQMIVLTNMVSQGHLTVEAILPDRDDQDWESPHPKMSALTQLTDGNYDAKYLNVERVHFPIAYRKTAKFTASHDLRMDVPLPARPKQVVGEQFARAPLWIDIHGRFMNHFWDLALRAIMHVVVFRPGVTSKSIEKAVNGKLWTWEIEMVMKWMEDVGIVKRWGAGNWEEGTWKGGYRTTEWWYCAFLPEIATWDDPEE